MPTRIDHLFYELDLKKQDFDRALAGAQRQLRTLEKNTGAAAQSVDRMDDRMRKADARTQSFRRSLAALGGVLAVIGIKRLATDLFDVATAVEETGAKFETVFGSASGTLDQFIESFGVMAGLSRQQARELLASTGALAQGFGFTRKESVGLSEDILRLAADLASFNNLQGGAAEATQILIRAMAGERESLKRLNITFQEKDVQQRALANTGKKLVKELTQQEKATASLQLITEKAGVAVGDLARTQKSAQNQARALRAEFQNMKEDLATSLMPAFVSFLGLLRDTVDGWRALLSVTRDVRISLNQLTTEQLEIRLRNLKNELDKLTPKGRPGPILGGLLAGFQLRGIPTGVGRGVGVRAELEREIKEVEKLLEKRSEAERKAELERQEIAQETADIIQATAEETADTMIDVAAEIAAAWEASLGKVGFATREVLVMELDAAKEAQRNLRQLRAEEEARAAEERQNAQERFRNLQATLGLIERSVDGTLELARAFGLVSDETADVIGNLEDIGSGIATLAASIPTANVPGIIAGGLQLLGGLAGLIGGGESPEQAARRRILEENNRRLLELGQAMDRMRGSFEITGSDFTRALQALGVAQGLPGGFAGIDAFAVRRELQRLGLTFGDLERIAGELGITIRDSAGNLIPAALVQLRDALQELEDGLVGFPATVEGVLRRLQIEFELLKVDDPVEQLRRLQEELLALAAGSRAGRGVGVPALQQLLGFDTSTAAGRAAAQREIERLFRLIATGALTPEALGVATQEEALDILRAMARLLDEIESNTEEQEGTTQDVRRSVHVTEVQANAILNRMDTGLFLAEERNALARGGNTLLADILATLRGQMYGIAPPAVSAAAAPSIDIVFENIHITTSGTDGETIAAEFVDEMDRLLGQRLSARRRNLGSVLGVS